MISYDDVYIEPRHSDIESRDNVNLETQFTRNHRIGCPVVASPMDTVMGTEMMKALDGEGCVGIMHRFGTDDEDPLETQVRAVTNATEVESTVGGPVCVSVGATGDFVRHAENLVDIGADVVLIDVAHGDHAHVKNAIYTLQEEVYQLGDVEFDIIAGNVATADGASRLAEWGADAVRVGIGNGCFTEDMEVKTKDGLKRIVDVEAGDEVLTHRNRWKEVVGTREKKPEEDLMVIDGIECTPNHEFYVVREENVDEVNEENIHEYAEWVRADELTENHYRVEL